MDTPLWMWGGFLAIVAVLLVLDLGILHKKDHEISVRESLRNSFFYTLIAIIFGVLVYHLVGEQAGKDFFTGYLVEESLSMDNIFVMALVFSYFGIPRKYQHRVLFWGILSVIILRGIMIGAGAILIKEFHDILYLFGAFLIFTGIKMLLASSDEETDLKNNKLLKWLQRHIHVTHELHGNKFFVQAVNAKGKMVRTATPLFLVLVFIEIADVVFAVDSVPAVFAVTTDPFIVYTSNIFAILGLRSLYFALSAMIHRFAYLKYALALVLVFIGAKIFLATIYPISSTVSLLVTLALLVGGVLLSLYRTRNEHKKIPGAKAGD